MSINLTFNHHHFLPSSSPFHHHKPTFKKPITLSATSSSSHQNQNPSSSSSSSQSPIFLPYLEQQTNPNPKPKLPKQPIKDPPITITDPIHQFFKTQTLSQNPHPDPPNEGKFTLQKNRRSSWHLAPNIKPDPPELPELPEQPEQVEGVEGGGTEGFGAVEVNGIGTREEIEERFDFYDKKSGNISGNGFLEIAKDFQENVNLNVTEVPELETEGFGSVEVKWSEPREEIEERFDFYDKSEVFSGNKGGSEVLEIAKDFQESVFSANVGEPGEELEERFDFYGRNKVRSGSRSGTEVLEIAKDFQENVSLSVTEVPEQPEGVEVLETEGFGTIEVNGNGPREESEESFDFYGKNKFGSGNKSVVEILEIANSLPENVTLGEVLGMYEGKLSGKDCVEVLGLMGQEEGLKGMAMCCLYFFEWMSLQEPSLVTPWAYSALFPVLGRARMGDKLMILFNNLPDSVEFKQVHVYNSAISALSYCGRYDDAWRLFEMMEKDNVEPDHVTCSIMITVMRKKGNSAKDAWEFFEMLNMRGLKWSLEVMGALIKSFCDEGLKKEALIIQLEMEKKGILSNAIIYNTIINAYSKSNRIEEAEGLFAEMKSKGIVPTTASYNILMDAYSRRMQPEVIEKLMIEMEETGLKPDVKSFTCLISAYGRQKKMSDMAADAFLRMKKLGIKPTSHSYTALIHAYSISGWHEKADVAFQNMLREGVKPSIETYTALLDSFRRAGDAESLMRIWKMMMNDKVEGTRVTFNILVDGFAKQGMYKEARDVICEFGKIGFQPTVMTYNMLINAYARGGQEGRLPQLLKEMDVLQLKPDSVTYSTTIYAYVRVRDFKRAFYYHKQMVKSGQVPDAKSYHKLRSILDVKAATKNKKDKSAIMGIISSKLGWVKIQKKAKKDEFWKNKKKWSRDRGSDAVGSR